MFSVSLERSFKISCSSWNITGSRKKKRFRLCPRNPGEPVPCLYWGFSGSGGPKTPHYWKLCILKKRTVPIWQITTLETWQVLFFCDAMRPGTCRHCKNGCVSRTNSEKSALSISIAQTEEFLLQLTTVTISIDWTSIWKVVDFPFKLSNVFPLLKSLWCQHVLLKSTNGTDADLL